jgi:cytochrome oxidase assembly protein ShyY1
VSEQPRRPDYLGTATTPRMLLALLLLLGAAAVCARLGVWQLDRAEIRGEVDAARVEAELQQEAPEPIDDVLAPGEPFAGEDVGRKVVVTGSFSVDELLVPGRELDGTTGYLVLSPLEVDDGGPVLAVVRGWAPTVRAALAAMPPPTGTVEVTGYLAAGEAAGPVPLPAEGGVEQVEAVSPAQLVNRWGGPMYPGYLVLADSSSADAAAGLSALEPPSLGDGGLNIQNLAYALQWWIFGGFAVLLWVRMVRDNARLEADEDVGGAGPDASEGDAATDDSLARAT